MLLLLLTTHAPLSKIKLLEVDQAHSLFGLLLAIALLLFLLISFKERKNSKNVESEISRLSALKPSKGAPVFPNTPRPVRKQDSVKGIPMDVSSPVPKRKDEPKVIFFLIFF